MISLRGVSASYDGGAEVLHDISADMPDGRNVCILGNNGSGKTTMLRTISGLAEYTGEIIIDGISLKNMSRREAASHVSMMSQFSEVYFSYTVYETVMLGRYIHNKGIFGGVTAADRNETERCLEAAGIADIRHKQIAELSGGQLQRVLLARTFAQDTHIILLDEPTNHLDIKYQEEMVRYLAEWSHRDGRILVGVFHDITAASALADDIIYMKDGSITAQGSRESMLEAGRLKDAFGIDVAAAMKQRYAVWNGI